VIAGPARPEAADFADRRPGIIARPSFVSACWVSGSPSRLVNNNVIANES